MADPSDGWHEALPAESRVRHPSDRSFGFTFAAIFSAFGLWVLWDGQAATGASLFVAAAILLLVTLLRPALLAPLNRGWSRVGVLVQSVASPIIMGFLFYVVVTPIGLLLRLVGHDPLRRRIDPKAKSYWIVRREPQTRMKDQF